MRRQCETQRRWGDHQDVTQTYVSLSSDMSVLMLNK